MCIKCKQKRSGATPTLCLKCFRQICYEWFKFHHGPIYDDYSEARFKNYMNRTQRRIRKAHKAHDDMVTVR